jgi:chemotaxis protein methyltransferase CheR
VEHLGLDGVESYRLYLVSHDEEWLTLASLCRVTISRFYRDRGVFDELRSRVLPRLAEAGVARGDQRVRCWSAGCASGEEPYTLAIAWQHGRFPAVLEVIATDTDQELLERARVGRYKHSSLKDLPMDLRDRAFEMDGAEYVIDGEIKCAVEFVHHDIRDEPPPGKYDLILCRNLPFTYFDDDGQNAVLRSIRSVITQGGILITGIHERLPAAGPGFEPHGASQGVYRCISPSDDDAS